MRLSIKNRMQLLVAFAVLPFLLYSLGVSLVERNRAEAHVKDTLHGKVAHVTEKIENIVEGTYDLLAATSRTIATDPQLDVNKYLETVNSEFPQYYNISVSDSAGNLLYSAIDISRYRNVSMSDRPWFRDVLKTGRFTTGTYFVGRVTARPSIAFLYPVHSEEGTIFRIVQASLNIDWLSRQILRHPLEKGEAMAVLDSKGTILCSSGGAGYRVGSSFRESALFGAVTREGEGTGMFRFSDGNEHIVAYGTVKGVSAPIYVIYGIPAASALAQAQKGIAREFLMAVAAIAVSFLISWLAGSLLLNRPLEALSNAVSRLSGGDLGARTGIDGRDDEIGLLAAAFDGMVEGLESRDRQQRELEWALRSSEERYRLLFDTMFNGFVLLEMVPDEAGNPDDFLFNEVNQAFATIFGQPRESLVARSLRQMFPNIEDEWLTIFREVVMTGVNRKFSSHSGYLDKYLEIFAYRPKAGFLACVMCDVTETVKKGEELKRKARIDAALAELYPVLVSPGETFDVMASGVAQQAMALTESRVAFISIIDPVTRWSRSIALFAEGEGDSRCRTRKSLFLEPGMDGKYSGLRGHPMNSSEPFFSNDYPSHHGALGLPAGHFEVKRFLSVPVLLDNMAAGQIALADPAGEYTRHDLEAVSRLAEFYVFAIQRIRSEEAIREYQRQLKSLITETTLTQERERRQIATILHDEIGQSLALANIKLGILEKGALPAERQSLTDVRRLVSETIEMSRLLTFETSPPILYQVGLLAALESLAETFRKCHGLPVEFRHETDSVKLGEEINVLLYHSTRELLMNVLKHAEATAVRIACSQQSQGIRITVSDNGVGMPLAEKTNGFGLFSIRERLSHLNGKMTIDTGPASGTTVTIQVPLDLEA